MENDEELLPEVRVTETIELYLNSILGLTVPGTMKMKARLGHKEISVLVDCGATHNFLSSDIIE